MSGRRTPQHPTPGLPGVNLLSPAAFEHIEVRRWRRRFLVSGVALLALVVALTVVQQLRVRTAEQEVEAVSAQTRKLTASVQELKPVQVYVAGVRSQVTTAQMTMMGEIFFSDVLAGVEQAVPPGTEMSTLTVALADLAAMVAETEEMPTAASACPGPDPFDTLLVVGCVALAGTADSRADVGEFVVALSKNGLFVEPFITTTTLADSTQVTFSGSVGLSPKVFSGRYAALAARLFPEEGDK